MAAKLVVEEGDLKGMTFSMENGDVWTVGRDPDECELVIEDPLVSRKHFLAHRTPEGITIQNLSATNPVQVNDIAIGEQPRLLKEGDLIKIGQEVLRFYENPSTLASGEEEGKQTSDATISAASETSSPSTESPREAPSGDTVFEEENIEMAHLAEIDFGVIETGRWLLKVVNGPNNGAEFYMQAGNRYVLGTDPNGCDIVFNDTSVSRQHARITVTSDDVLSIEDLKSRNGVLIGGAPIEELQPLPANTVVTLGTTSFVVYDREGAMQTIISPLLPSIVKVLQGEPLATEAAPPPIPTESPAPTPQPPIPDRPPIPATPEPPPQQPTRQMGPYIVLAVVIGLFALAGIGTSALFRSEPVTVESQINADELIRQTLKPFPSVRYTFNPSTGRLLLLGHVTSLSEKNQLLYALQSLKFVKSSPDDTGLVIDEYVWQEVNSILADNPAWQGISIHSPTAGQFILSGYLQTRKQANQLSSFISLNFPYLDLLKKQIIVEEDVLEQIHGWLQNEQLSEVVPTMHNGEIILTGGAPGDKMEALRRIVEKIKQIPGVRVVNILVRPQTTETGVIDLSNSYQVTGKSRIGNTYTVVINGHLLSENSELDGMTITQIASNRILLEKGQKKYRIDY